MSELEQKKYKTMYDWVEKVFPWELCKFDNIIWWYMYKPEFVLENESHKILWDFDSQMDHLIPTRRKGHVIKWILQLKES